MAKKKKARATKYEKKVVLKEGVGFTDLIKVALNHKPGDHSLKEEIAKRKQAKD